MSSYQNAVIDALKTLDELRMCKELGLEPGSLFAAAQHLDTVVAAARAAWSVARWSDSEAAMAFATQDAPRAKIAAACGIDNQAARTVIDLIVNMSVRPSVRAT